MTLRTICYGPKRDRESRLIGIRGVGLIQRLPKTRLLEFPACAQRIAPRRNFAAGGRLA
jgi:hypothetical protein